MSDKPNIHSLSPKAVAFLFEGETLYHISEPYINDETSEKLDRANERSLPKFNAQNKILILLDKGWDAQTPKAQNLLRDIVEKGLQQHFQENTMFFPDTDLLSVDRIENLAYPILALGWMGKTVDGRQLTAGINKLAEGKLLIASPSLEALTEDRNAKAALWKSMKEAFGL